MPDPLTNAAVLAAEIGLDLLEYAILDAAALEVATRYLVLATVTNDDAIGHAYRIAAAAAELEAKLRRMAAEVRPRLGEVIAAHRDNDAMAVH